VSDAEAPATLSYEQARAELDRIVSTLERGSPTLEEALALWQRGEELAEVCTRWLDGAQATLQAATGTESDEE
jgi:exodeoxyribonuclease VII small subunit